MSHLPQAVPTSLPYIRDSVNARSITPVKPTRWFLVPDSTPCSERKRRHSGTVQGQRKLIPKEQRCNYSQWPVATVRVFAGSECSGEKGDHIRLSPKTLLFIVQPDRPIGSHHSCVLFHRLLVASHPLLSNLNLRTLPPDGAGWRILRSRWSMKREARRMPEHRADDG